MKKLSDTDAAWLGGLLSGHGVFAQSSKGSRDRPVIMLTVQSIKRPEMVERFSVMVESPIRPAKINGPYVRLTDFRVERLLAVVGPWLTAVRYREYTSLLAHVKDEQVKYEEARNNKLAYEAQRAATSFTPEQRRKRAEALYDGSDPAVELVDDETIFDPQTMAIPSDLASAAAYRAAEMREKDRLLGDYSSLDYRHKEKQ